MELMKTTLDINDLWDALEGRRVWASWADVSKGEADRQRKIDRKLRALKGATG